MPLRLDAGAPDFAAAFDALLNAKRDSDDAVSDVVADILEDVRSRGDMALAEYTRRFDRFEVEHAADLRVPSDDLDRAVEALDPALADAFRLAAYPSSVLMNAVPAKVAGVGRTIMVVPTPDGIANTAVLAAARIAGVDEVWRIGGAQAIAALAYGTGTIRPVDKIVGPGNAYVAAAKRQVFGTVGIDLIAGPSEVVVVADRDNDPAWIAADLMAQAEHDPGAQSILIADDAGFADAVSAAVDHLLGTLERGEVARQSWERFGAVILVEALDDACALVDRLAPEHLELAIADPDAFARKVRHAGAIFLGRHTPEAIGDYLGGPNHVLPTSRSARFSSGLGVLDFMKRTTLLGCDAGSLARLAEPAALLADSEGLGAHALSIRTRTNAAGRG